MKGFNICYAAVIDDVMEAIGFLKESSGGRCSFITRNIAAPHSPTPSGAVGLLAKVTIAPAFHRLIEPLLAGVYLTDDLHSAFRLAGEFPELTFVTPQGELVHSAGIIHGGSMETNQQGVIHKKREIRDLSRAVATLAQVVADLGAGRTSMQEEIAAIEEELRELRQKLHQGKWRRPTLRRTCSGSGRGVSGWRSARRSNGWKMTSSGRKRRVWNGKWPDAGTNLSTGEERKSSLEMGVVALQDALAVKRQELGEMRETLTATKVRTAALKEKTRVEPARRNKLRNWCAHCKDGSPAVWRNWKRDITRVRA